MSAAGIVPGDVTAGLGDGLVLATSTTSTSSRTTSTLATSTLSTASTLLSSTATGTASATNTSSSSSSIPPAGYLSPAEAAGVGIGSAFAGALLSVLLFYLITRGSSRRDRQYHNDDTNASTRTILRPQSPEIRLTTNPAPISKDPGILEKGATPMISMKEVPSSSLGTSNAAATVPAVVDEQTIRQPWAALEARVRQHVGNMYHQQYVQPSVFRSEMLGALGYNRQSPALSQLVELLANVATRASTLSYLLAVVISQRIDFCGNPKTTFLPPELVACMKAMHVNSMPKDSFTQWRTLTQSLSSKSYSATSISRNDPRSTAINSAIHALMPLLRPLVHENRAAKAFEDLEDIFEDAARFGLVVFGSPASWGFEWERGERAFKERGEAPGWPAVKRLDSEGAAASGFSFGGIGMGMGILGSNGGDARDLSRRTSLFREGR